jgi:hypothetical protein
LGAFDPALLSQLQAQIAPLDAVKLANGIKNIGRLETTATYEPRDKSAIKFQRLQVP